MENESVRKNMPERSGSVTGLEDNLKKAVAEMLVLFLLSEREMYIGEIPLELERRSNGKIHIVFPYSVIYRMVKFGYIQEQKKCIAPDGRKRQYYAATGKGQQYLGELRKVFGLFYDGVTDILSSEGEQDSYEKCSNEEILKEDQTGTGLQPSEQTEIDEESGKNDRGFYRRPPECFI